MAGVPRIVTAPLISVSYTGSGAAFNILYTNSSYIKLSTGFNSGAAQAASTGVMVLGSSISKTIANDALKGPDHVSVIGNSIMPVSTVAGALGIKVNGGPIWNKATSLTYNGGWVQAIADPTATPSGTPLGGSGTALSVGNTVSNISMHMNQTYTGGSESMFEAGGMAGSWIGKEISIDGGTAVVGNEITFRSISDEDRSQTRSAGSPFTGYFYGHVEIGGGVSRLNAPVQIGNANGTTVTHMLEKDTTIEWTDNPVNTKFYRLDIIGAATTVIWGDAVNPAPVTIASANVANNRWALNTSTQEPAGHTCYGATLKHGISWTLGSTTSWDGGVTQDVLDVAMNAGTQIKNQQIIAARLDYGLPPAINRLTDSVFSSPVDYCMTVSAQTANMTIDYDFAVNARGAGKAINFTHTTGNILITANAGYYQPVLADVTVSGAGTVSFPAGNPVDVTVKVLDHLNAVLPNANVHMEAITGGSLPALAAITITRVGTTATVTHTSSAHNLTTGDRVKLRSTGFIDYNIVASVTVTGVSTYTIQVANNPTSPASGTATFVALNGITDVNGEITASRVYSVNQPIKGNVRSANASPFYKSASLLGPINSVNGLLNTVKMILNES